MIPIFNRLDERLLGVGGEKIYGYLLVSCVCVSRCCVVYGFLDGALCARVSAIGKILLRLTSVDAQSIADVCQYLRKKPMLVRASCGSCVVN